MSSMSATVALIHAASQPSAFHRTNKLAKSVTDFLNTVLDIQMCLSSEQRCAVHWPAASWHFTTVRVTVSLCSDEKGVGGVLKSTSVDITLPYPFG